MTIIFKKSFKITVILFSTLIQQIISI